MAEQSNDGKMKMKRPLNCRFKGKKGCGLLILATALAVAGCRTMHQAAGMGPDREPPGADTVIVARINEQTLTHEALERQYNLYFTVSGDVEDYQQEVSLEAFLGRYVLEILLLQEARSSGVHVSQDEIAAEMAAYLDRAGISKEVLSNRLAQVGLGITDADHFFENDLVIDRWSRIKFGDLSVSNEEALAFYNENPEFFTKAVDTQDAGTIPFEDVKDAIRENLTTARIQSALLSYATQLRDTADIQLYDMESGSEVPAAQTDAQILTSTPETHSPFPTFKDTGHDPCTDEGGRPLILLFSASSCSHCQWVGGVFDLIAREYADQGLVTAHHYDVETGDDLLTEAVETRIPEEHLSIGKRGDPDGHIPYFNFGCRYDRIGTGYEEQNDLAAEAQEMSRVIEALLP